MAKQKGHRWFAAFWDWQTRHEPRTLQRWRQEIAGGARGRVLEIGCGSGCNFTFYTDAATEVVATDPDPFVLGRSRSRAADIGRAIDVREASAEALPFEDATFDTVVSTANICSVDDPAKALSEVRRVLKPGGEYRFFDHVRYRGAIGGLFQDVATPLWEWLGAGCHPNRDVERFIRGAGLDIVRLEHPTAAPPIPPFVIVRPCIKGVATRN
ncbi:MAG: class I SAM-dependent methyltransferase [Chloroflexota bacterium]|nr:class I SAM-dependent methyltransferase [Chloroflexota bacterium]